MRTEKGNTAVDYSYVRLSPKARQKLTKRVEAGENIRQVAADYGITPREVENIATAQSQTCPTLNIDPWDLTPSAENGKVYKPVDPEDPAIQELARDIAENGILEPLVVTIDNHILSGHRRREAAILAGLGVVPCRVENIYSDDPGFLNKLISYNAQRVKDHGEQLREVLIRTNPDEAYEQLIEYREAQAAVLAETVNVSRRKPRKKISHLKSEMVAAVVQLIDEFDEFWPLSVRQIHYLLLNNPPLRNTNRRKSRYRNNRRSYQDLCDLLTRLRLDETIPMSAIADETRPTTSWYVHANAQDFAQKEFNDLLKGYRRNLQQTQPLHIEVVAEKLTLKPFIKPICGKYNIPYTIGRGYGSLPSRWEIIQRFRRSGKERLCLIVLGDLDPEGVNIGESLLQSMREDFGEDGTEAVRAGLNPEHVQRFHLSENTAEAKTSSSRYADFVQRFGRQVYELEALGPNQLQDILTEGIDSLIDKRLFNIELEAEREDATYLQAVRKKVRDDCLSWLEDPQ
ncbi:MAG: chromosome partitioning protein ParB [Planctomycetes bacterium B3_Pla]|nr:MAG: chromosome partitioning protein ParB [Planctomycetes bacterium B3_Pla]